MFMVIVTETSFCQYCKVPEFKEARKLCCNLPKIQTKRPIFRVFRQKDAYGIANSEDPDQTAGSSLVAKACLTENLGPLQYL